jgi:hypothetical protein
MDRPRVYPSNSDHRNDRYGTLPYRNARSAPVPRPGSFHREVSDEDRGSHLRLFGCGQCDTVVLPLRRPADDCDPPRVPFTGHVRRHHRTAARLSARRSGVRHPQPELDGRLAASGAGRVVDYPSRDFVRSVLATGSSSEPNLALREQSLLSRQSGHLTRPGLCWPCSRSH